ncbi:MAG: hypothetical protein R3F17_05350 [Planctomycetota bacterium]
MNAWATFWAVIFGLTLVGYAALVIWVCIGGMADIRSMLAALSNKDHARD